MVDTDSLTRLDRASGDGESSSTPGAASDRVDADPYADLGRALGRYVLVERIGEGGMGTVERAYDPKLHREVALKRVRRGAVGTEAAARMLREAQAMAQLSHPNVVAVHDVEVIDDVVVLAMEYVAGPTLDVWCAAPARPWRAIVGAYVQAAQGLLAAHRVGLVHRDFKPSNALVTDDGRVKVLDFGLAKPVADAPQSESSMLAFMSGTADSVSLERTLTRADTVVGTPKYMAPEQHVGDAADARADQYAYCVALWEALARAPVFASQDFDGLVAMKQSGPPPWPAIDGVPAALGEALRRGLAPDPTRRWPDMAALVAVLEAHARPPERAGTRNRWLIGAGAAAIAAVVVTRLSAIPPCAEAGARMRETWSEARRGELAASFHAAGSVIADDMAARVGALVDERVDRWRAAAVEACEATRVRGEQSEALLDLRSACLERRRVELDVAVQQLVDDPGVVAAAVDLITALPALEVCADAEALQAEMPPPRDAELAARVDAAREQLAHAASSLAAGHFEVSLGQALAVNGEATLDEYPPLAVETELAVAAALARLARWAEVVPRLEAALSTALQRGYDESAVRAAIALANAVGVSLMRPREGHVHAEVALALARRRDPGGELEAEALAAMGAVVGTDGRGADAEARLRESLALFEALRGDDSLDAARLHALIGMSLWSQGRFAEAEVEHRRGLAIRSRRLGPDHPDTAASHGGLGNALLGEGRLDDALTEFAEALHSRERSLGVDHPETANARANLARVYQAMGRNEDAAQEQLRALESLERSLGREHPMTAGHRLNYGITLMRQDRLAEAEQEFRSTAESFARSLSPEHPYTATAQFNVGKVLVRQGRVDDGIAWYQRALVTMLAAQGPEHRDTAAIRINLADALEAQGQLREAEVELRKAVAALTSSLGPRHVDTGGARNNLSGLLETQGRLEEAEAEARVSLEIIVESTPETNPNLAIAFYDLGDLVRRNGRTGEAVALLERALALSERAEIVPHERGEIMFGLARALFETPAQRQRALGLARQALTLYREDDAGIAGDRRELQEWLAVNDRESEAPPHGRPGQ